VTDTLATPADDFRELAAELRADPAEGATLTEAALCLAALFAGPQNRVAASASLDLLAEICRPGVEAAGSNRERAEALVDALARNAGFRGSRDDYYDPRNSFLGDVLERRSGIPITLALVYVEVARRLDLPVLGVSFPGHFLARLRDDEQREATVWIDAFEGLVLDDKDCAARWKQIVGEAAPFVPQALASATVLDFLIRMTNNLKQIYLEKRDAAYAWVCCDALVELHGGAPAERRDRGLLYEQLGRPSLAREDLEAFLRASPNDESAPMVRQRLAGLQGQKEQLN
jgi:regulator of sirC expression with transglutaminase-like and TPR domain